MHGNLLAAPHAHVGTRLTCQPPVGASVRSGQAEPGLAGPPWSPLAQHPSPASSVPFALSSCLSSAPPCISPLIQVMSLLWPFPHEPNSRDHRSWSLKPEGDLGRKFLRRKFLQVPALCGELRQGRRCRRAARGQAKSISRVRALLGPLTAAVVM